MCHHDTPVSAAWLASRPGTGDSGAKSIIKISLIRRPVAIASRNARIACSSPSPRTWRGVPFTTTVLAWSRGSPRISTCPAMRDRAAASM
jgi:hypothetical protein